MKHRWEYVIFDAYRCSICGKSVITTGMSEEDVKKLEAEECSGVLGEFKSVKEMLKNG